MVGEPIRRWFVEKKGFRRGRNLFCYDADPAKGYFDDCNSADVIFVSVPTPPNPDGSCNTSIVANVVASVKGERIVVIKSTVPPGTTEYFQNKFPQHNFLFNPEFLTESQAWEDFLKPVRQIVGYTERSKNVALTVLNLLPMSYYQSPWISSTYVVRGHTATEAEVIKYYSNISGAVTVAISNMFYDVCSGLRSLGCDIDYENVKEAISADPRIGPAWKDVNHGLYRGFGGYCFPKDLNAFRVFVGEVAQKMKGTRKDLLLKTCFFLTFIWDYNACLLKSQNLTVEDVSKHDKEIILKKKKDMK
jgi:nucleotide sugar dehydrogenase